MTTATDPPDASAPKSASARAYLRTGLPAVYRERLPGTPGEPFAVRFVEGLEQVLDPIVSMLDLLPAHLGLDLAPPEVVALVGQWLGLELDAALTPEAQRRLVREATSITRARGTRAGLGRLLELAFEGAGLEVRDGGGATWSSDPRGSQPAAEPAFIVLCPAAVSAPDRAAIRRLVIEVKPAHVGFELGVQEEQPG
jgi:phage tail-like protein